MVLREQSSYKLAMHDFLTSRLSDASMGQKAISTHWMYTIRSLS